MGGHRLLSYFSDGRVELLQMGRPQPGYGRLCRLQDLRAGDRQLSVFAGDQEQYFMGRGWALRPDDYWFGRGGAG